MDIIDVYTDGACSGNPGPGGWGAIISSKDGMTELSGGNPYTTNNRMELTAVISSLLHLQPGGKISIYTDSVYVKSGISLWIHKWKANGWQTADKKPVKNKELWQELDRITAHHNISWHWVKAHSGNELNERADFIARQEAAKQCSTTGLV